MAKRGNEDSQLSKEDYEAKINQKSATSGTFSVASAEVLAQRKIRRRSAKWQSAVKPSKPTTPTPSSSNPFGGISLTAAGAATAPPKQATFAFGSSAPSVAPKPAFLFGQASAPAKETETSKSVSFAASSPKKSAAAGSKISRGSGKNEEKIIAMTESFVKAVTEATPGSDLSDVFKAYICRYGRLQRDQGATVSLPLGPKKAPLPPSRPRAINASTPAPKSSAPSFAATPGPPKTPGPEAGMTPAPQKGDIPSPFAPSPVEPKPLFPSAPAASPKIVPFSFAAPASSAPTFSFASSAPASAPVPAPAVAASEQNADNADAQNEEGDSVDKRESADVDWDVIETVRVGVFVQPTGGEKGLKKLCTGDLKLQSHKTEANNNRIVMRDDIGVNLRLNMVIKDGMKFTKGGATKKRGSVVFKGINDASVGAQTFYLQCRLEDTDRLRDGLENLSKK